MNREKRLRIPPVVRRMARGNRKQLTKAEDVLRQRLRMAKLDNWKFRRQHPIRRFIADFYCAEAKLLVELDGSSHDDTVDYDGERTEWLGQQGYTVIGSETRTYRTRSKSWLHPSRTGA